MPRSFMIQERTEGVDRWIPVNGHLYPDFYKLLDYADRRVRVEGVTEVRIVEFEHTDPRVVETISKENK